MERELSLAPTAPSDSLVPLPLPTATHSPGRKALPRALFLLESLWASQTEAVSATLFSHCVPLSPHGPHLPCPRAISGSVSLFLLVVSSCRAKSGSDSSKCPQDSGQSLALMRVLNRHDNLARGEPMMRDELRVLWECVSPPLSQVCSLKTGTIRRLCDPTCRRLVGRKGGD